MHIHCIKYRLSYQNVTPEQIPVLDQTLFDFEFRRRSRSRRPSRLRRRRRRLGPRRTWLGRGGSPPLQRDGYDDDDDGGGCGEYCLVAGDEYRETAVENSGIIHVHQTGWSNWT